MPKNLWNRHLDCGHERRTDLGFLLNYKRKPRVNDVCFCRKCSKNTIVIKVEKIEVDRNA